MGLGDIWVDIQAFWIDINDYSTAEMNKDRYKRVVSELNKKIPTCDELLTQADTCGTSFHESFTSNDSASKGKWKKKFDDKETLWDGNRTSLMKVMGDALSIAKERLAEAEGLAEEWAKIESDQETRIRKELQDKQEERRKQEEKARKKAQAAWRKW